MATFPDYYEILGIPSTSTYDQIKTAYKRKSLVTHPDRVPPGATNDARRARATQEFQAVADAYYTLSDPTRRKAYDELRRSNSSTRTSAADSSGSYWDFFGGGRGAGNGESYGSTAGSDAGDWERPDAEHVFGETFDDLLRPEVHRVMPLWTWAGAAAGATLGFIAGNIAGATIGGFAGSRLGAIRDAKGKSVYAVFTQLEAAQKAEILRALAVKVFGMSGIADAWK
ncbi:hypothetical protein JCM10212_001502 [Sporobolomyces blumeae]